MRILILIFIYDINMSVHHISSTTEESRATNPERAAELCSNWWPTPSLANATSIPGMPHSLCRMCANWLPDIEDIGIVRNNSTCYTKNKIGCGNDWSNERNTHLNEKGQFLSKK